jgi:Xaa-Pro dipeptidase
MSLYRQNRLNLMHRLPGGLIFLLGGKEQIRNGDVHHVFRQNSHFLYLTGIEEPGYALLLNPEKREALIFVPRVDQRHRVWQGTVPSPSEAKALHGFRRAAYLDELPYFLTTRKRSLFYGDKPSLTYLKTHLGTSKMDFREFEEALSELRAVKSPEEIELLRKANKTSDVGHRAAMAYTRPGLCEYQVQAVLEQGFRQGGARHNAYPSIVGSGRNSAILHYHRNNAELKGGDLLLIDAGAEYKGYASDITRTFPVNKRFNSRQRDVYDIVLTTQKRCITKLCPGLSLRNLDLSSARIIIQGLKSLGLLKGSADSILERGADRVFYPHGLSHMLGLDVHDVLGGKKRQIKRKKKKSGRTIRSDVVLEPGFVITIEPGLYFIPALLHDRETRKRFRDLIDFERAEAFIPLGGIRIEDDVAITENGYRNLTSVPKEIEDIEAACTDMKSLK